MNKPERKRKRVHSREHDSGTQHYPLRSPVDAPFPAYNGMIRFKSKKKYLIKIVPIYQVERHKQFEIKLPSNVKRITGVIITTALK